MAQLSPRLFFLNPLNVVDKILYYITKGYYKQELNLSEKGVLNITYQSPEDKEDTSNDPGFYSCESLSLGNIGGDGVEDIDKNKENSDEQSHPRDSILNDGNIEVFANIEFGYF